MADKQWLWVFSWSYLVYKGHHRCHIWDIFTTSELKHLHSCGISFFRHRHTDTGGITLDPWPKMLPKLQNNWPFFLVPSQVGGVCKLSTESSLRRCRTPDDKICSGRGKCDCGICICEAAGPGKFYGPRCECHDWVCATHNGKTCNGAYNGKLTVMTDTRWLVVSTLFCLFHNHLIINSQTYLESS